MPIRRVLILGHTGFVGSNLERRLRAAGLDTTGLSPNGLDLTRREDARTLAEYFEPGTAVVMCSAIKRQAGDSLENFEKNLAMAETLSPLLQERPVGRFIYFSSTAVYGEDVHDTSITEKTAVHPTSYYGMAKVASEWLFSKAVEKKATSPLLVLRPATLCGADEPGRPYGPMGFLRAALAGEPITLWGEGDEKREFIWVDDACEAVRRLLDHPFSGVLNLVSGRSVTFQEVLEAVGRRVSNPKVSSRPRTKEKVDHAFDNALLRRVLPDLRFTPLEEGIQKAHDTQVPILRG